MNEGLGWRTGTCVVAAILAYRLALVLLWPACYGGDALGRLEHQDEPVWSPVQLPATSIVVWAVARVSPAPMAQRLFFAFLGACACMGFGSALSRASGRRAGMAAALLLGCNPAFTEWSVVPYGEPLLVLLLLPGIALYDLGRGRLAPIAGAMLVLLATTVRYEAWFAAAVLVLWPAPGRRWIAAAMLSFAAAWTAWHAGPSPMGIRSLHLGLSIATVTAAVALLLQTTWLVTPAPLVLACLGAARARREADAGVRRFYLHLAALLVVDVVFVVAARPYDDVLNPRQTILPSVLLLAFAAAAVAALERPSRAAIVVAALVLAWPAALGTARVRRAATATDPRAGHALGRHLEGAVPSGSRVLMDAPTRADHPYLEPTAIRWTRVQAPALVIERARWDDVAGPRWGDYRYFAAVVPSLGAKRARSPEEASRLQAVAAPDPAVALYRIVPSPDRLR